MIAVSDSSVCCIMWSPDAVNHSQNHRFHGWSKPSPDGRLMAARVANSQLYIDSILPHQTTPSSPKIRVTCFFPNASNSLGETCSTIPDAKNCKISIKFYKYLRSEKSFQPYFLQKIQPKSSQFLQISPIEIPGGFSIFQPRGGAPVSSSRTTMPKLWTSNRCHHQSPWMA